jgi:hypothetical protein
MFSITLKRSAAAIGVAAGLLAAAGPASAMDYMGSPVVTYSVKAPTTPPANGFIIDFSHTDVKAPKPPASSEEPTESISFNYLKTAGTETGNPERKGSVNASGGWDPTHALNSQGIAQHAVATAIVGGASAASAQQIAVDTTASTLHPNQPHLGVDANGYFDIGFDAERVER